MFLVMSLMIAKIGQDGTEGGAITPRCGAELKLGSGDKASRGWGWMGEWGGGRWALEQTLGAGLLLLMMICFTF